MSLLLTSSLFIACPTCKTEGIQCCTTVFSLTQDGHHAYRPSCDRCCVMGYRCPLASEFTGNVYTVETAVTESWLSEIVDLTTFNAQRIAVRNRYADFRSIGPVSGKPGESSKTAQTKTDATGNHVAVKDTSSTAPSADDLDAIIRRGLDSQCQAMRRYLDLSEDLKAGRSPTLVIDRLMNGLQKDCKDHVEMWELLDDMKRRLSE